MGMAAAVDNCGAVVALGRVTTAGACAGDYVITRTWTATDDCGNASSATQTITIIDTTAPELTIPADYTAECSDEHPMDEATATDNCGEVVITVEEVTTAGACAGDYVITRTFTAADDCGNASTLLRLSLIDTTLQSSLQFQLTTRQSVLTNTQWMKLLLLTTVKWLSLWEVYYCWRLCWRLRNHSYVHCCR